MSFIAQADADSITRQFFPDFIGVVNSAWADWLKGSYAHQMQHKRVRATCVWNQMLTHAKRCFDGRQGIRVDTLRVWDGVLVGDRVFVRMKKGTRELRSNNYPTQTSLAFHDASQDLFGGVARLELVYVLNDAETEVERIALVQRHKSRVVWFIDLLDTAAGESAQTVMPFVPPKPEGSPAKRMIKPKKGPKTDGKREPRSGS